MTGAACLRGKETEGSALGSNRLWHNQFGDMVLLPQLNMPTHRP